MHIPAGLITFVCLLSICMAYYDFWLADPERPVLNAQWLVMFLALVSSVAVQFVRNETVSDVLDVIVLGVFGYACYHLRQSVKRIGWRPRRNEYRGP
jgi:hypothetical protein